MEADDTVFIVAEIPIKQLFLEDLELLYAFFQRDCILSVIQ